MNSFQKVLVTGRGGQLASEFELIMSKNKNWVFLSAEELDITDSLKVLETIKNIKPDLVINCAAYTAVDKAEEEKAKAFEVNQVGVKNLAEACFIVDSKIIHYSTDYVFDGQSIVPYTETHIPNPTGVYGKSKLGGEQVLAQSNAMSIIIRTSWVYSQFGNNFVKTMLKLAKSMNTIGVVSDQIGSPTNANDLAKATIEIINNKNYVWSVGDIFHFSNDGVCSWYQFAKEIFRISKIKLKLKKLSSDEFKTKAIRPKYSLLDKRKIIKSFDLKIDDWNISLKRTISNLKIN